MNDGTAIASVVADEQGSAATVAPRRWWIIVFLTLVGGTFSFVYCGQLLRACLWQLLWLGFSIGLCAAMLYSSYPRLAVVMLAASIPSFLLLIFLRAISFPPNANWKWYQNWWGYAIIYVAQAFAWSLVTHEVREHWAEAFVVPSRGMQNTVMPGDRVFVEKATFDPERVERGTVVAFRSPEGPLRSAPIYLGRVVALGNDAIRIDSDRVYVNQEEIDEEYVILEGTPPPDTPPVKLMRNYPESIVPSGFVFVMGDNRWQSKDSRIYGVVPLENLIGEAKMIFWSREYELIPPTPQNPKYGEKWGGMRWDRIGIAIQ